ncbi:MAG: hypothetical protein CSA81_08970 [Acidobacteria bacterium]|nr:MAG: hypothetical protein CSA81_08970 [Acidobacteriota bacterium]
MHAVLQIIQILKLNSKYRSRKIGLTSKGMEKPNCFKEIHLLFVVEVFHLKRDKNCQPSSCYVHKMAALAEKYPEQGHANVRIYFALLSMPGEMQWF